VDLLEDLAHARPHQLAGGGGGVLIATPVARGLAGVKRSFASVALVSRGRIVGHRRIVARGDAAVNGLR
jgi:hypothetical protein